MRPTRGPWRLRERTIAFDASSAVMGIVNVTPDSFSDGGLHRSPSAAVAHGLRLVDRGAAIVDVGGESSRPGASPVATDEELRRVMPVVEGLTAAGAIVSIDTVKPDVAAAAIDAGAQIVNDITGLTSPEMRQVCARTGVGVVIMHMRGEPATMQEDPTYDDVVAEVATFLSRQAEVAVAAGIAADRIAVDPGIGFGKTFEHNLLLLGGLDRIAALGFPVLVGVSRKGFLAAILEASGIEPTTPNRDVASAAGAAAAVLAGADIVRTHDVATTRAATTVADAIVRGRSR